MKTYTVSEELLIEAHKEACDKWKKIIEGIAPEAFKPKLEKGKWYIHRDLDAIFKSNGLQLGAVGYGIDGAGNWTNEFFIYGSDINCYRLATDKEVESHLISMAEKKGFKVDNFKCINSFTVKLDESPIFFYEQNSDALWFGVKGNANCCYKQGKWATILPQESIEITLEEIAKWKGVDVEAIKIKK